MMQYSSAFLYYKNFVHIQQENVKKMFLILSFVFSYSPNFKKPQVKTRARKR